MLPLFVAACDPNTNGACDRIQEAKRAIDERILVGARAGFAEGRRRSIEGMPQDSELPASPYLASGELDPIVKRWAFDGDKRLRGKGATLTSLSMDLDQAIKSGKGCPRPE